MPEVGERPGGNGPWGDSFIVQTPNLDRISQQYQQMALDRKAYIQKEGQQTNDLINKELANVRSVDMGGISDLYNKWKQASQPLYFNKALLNNPKKYNEAQMQANALQGELRAKINQSAQLNQVGKQLAQDRTTPGKSNLYSDDFGDKAAAFWKTPMDQLQSHPLGDLTNPDTYRYRGMNNTNFGALEKVAAGTPTQKYQKEEQISPLQKNITPYTFGNTPAQFQQSLRGQYASNPATYRAASAAWESIPQQEKDRVDQAFASLPKEKWEQMGAGGPQAVEPTNPNDPADNLAAYKAKIYAINNNPAAGKVYPNIDQAQKMKVQFDDRKIMEAIKEGNREKLKTLGHEFKKMDVAQQSSILDNTYNSMIDDAKSSGTYTYKTANGKVSKQYEIKASPALKKDFSVPDEKGHPIYPDAFRIDDSGNTVTPIFFTGKAVNGIKSVDEAVSKPMTSVEFKARLGKALYGVKEAAKETTTGGTHIESLRSKYSY